MSKKYHDKGFNVPANKKDFFEFCRRRFPCCRNLSLRTIKCCAFAALVGIIIVMQIGIPLSLCLILVVVGCFMFSH